MAANNTADISELALARYDALCTELAADRLALASVMYAESGWHNWAHNPNGHASGICQAMPSTLLGLGFHPELPPEERAAAFRSLSVADQMPWVRRYYAPYKGKLGNVSQCYLATFLPADLPKANQPDYQLAVKGGFRSVVYTANAGFDANRDLVITVSELAQAVRRQCTGPRWAELVGRLSDGALQPQAGQATPLALGTVRGLQEALVLLGYSPGQVDGVYGPATATALKAYQAARGLNPDGLYGPLTKAMLTGDVRSEHA